MRILAVDHSAELGGAQLSLLSMARELGDGLAVLLLEEGELVKRLQAQETQVEVVNLNSAFGAQLRTKGVALVGRRYASVLKDMRDSILESARTHQADVLLFNSLRTTVFGATMRWPGRYKRVVMVRDGIRGPYLRPHMTALAQTSVNVAATCIIANSRWTERQIRTFRRSAVVAPFLPRVFFDKAPFPREPTGTVRVLMLGRLAPWKGQLEALQEIGSADIGAQWEVTVAGGSWFHEEEYMQRVSEEIEKIGNVQINILGHVDDVSSLIDQHDIVLHTSILPEPFGQVVPQGMSRSRTVVATNMGGPAEIISHMKDGILYDPTNPGALRRVLERIVVDSTLREELGHKARISAQRYHPELTVQHLRSAIYKK